MDTPSSPRDLPTPTVLSVMTGYGGLAGRYEGRGASWWFCHMTSCDILLLQGYKCQACKITIHKKCVYYLRHICEGHPVSSSAMCVLCVLCVLCALCVLCVLCLLCVLCVLCVLCTVCTGCTVYTVCTLCTVYCMYCILYVQCVLYVLYVLCVLYILYVLCVQCVLYVLYILHSLIWSVYTVAHKHKVWYNY